MDSQNELTGVVVPDLTARASYAEELVSRFVMWSGCGAAPHACRIWLSQQSGPLQVLRDLPGVDDYKSVGNATVLELMGHEFEGFGLEVE
jgi:hypothetical protein